MADMKKIYDDLIINNLYSIYYPIPLGGGRILGPPHRLVPTKVFDIPAPMVTSLQPENK